MATFHFDYILHDSINELSEEEKKCLLSAQAICKKAYAPYSNFHVGASVLLDNGLLIEGVNIENASYPVGICAERSALASALSSHPEAIIEIMAISYLDSKNNSNAPIAPCGLCRQFLLEVENKQAKPIKIILGGLSGDIMIIPTVKHLLPLYFDAKNL
ncbi:MAG: cytidine deaminase [Chitinophagaceae bacterium]